MISIENGRVVFFGKTGSVDISSPWSGEDNPITVTRVMEGDWVYFGSRVRGEFWTVEFISLRGLNQLSVWHLNELGQCVSQEQINASVVGPLGDGVRYPVMNTSANIMLAASKYLNDLQIYNAWRYLFRDVSMAQAHMSSLAPIHKAKNFHSSSTPRVEATFIFNHNYARNIRKLERQYHGRFSAIRYVLPNVAPIHESCFCFPAGSFSYQTLIYYFIRRLSESKGVDAEAWYLFAHDDIYLNSDFSESQFNNFVHVNENSSSAYYLDVHKTRWDSNSDWQWNERILNRINHQKHSVLGNGFEGLDLFFDPTLLTAGVGDLFFVRGKYLTTFAEILGNYISQDVFAEISIPSSLKALCSMTGTNVGGCVGEYIWGEDRAKVDVLFIEQFDASGRLFFHPVKSDLALYR